MPHIFLLFVRPRVEDGRTALESGVGANTHTHTKNKNTTICGWGRTKIPQFGLPLRSIGHDLSVRLDDWFDDVGSGKKKKKIDESGYTTARREKKKNTSLPVGNDNSNAVRGVCQSFYLFFAMSIVVVPSEERAVIVISSAALSPSDHCCFD